jgi:hypothetical protein
MSVNTPDLSSPEQLCFCELFKSVDQPEGIPSNVLMELLDWVFIDEEVLTLRNERLLEERLLHDLPVLRSNAEIEARFGSTLNVLRRHGVFQGVGKDLVSLRELCELADEPNALMAAYEAMTANVTEPPLPMPRSPQPTEWPPLRQMRSELWSFGASAAAGFAAIDANVGSFKITGNGLLGLSVPNRPHQPVSIRVFQQVEGDYDWTLHVESSVRLDAKGNGSVQLETTPGGDLRVEISPEESLRPAHPGASEVRRSPSLTQMALGDDDIEFDDEDADDDRQFEPK